MALVSIVIPHFNRCDLLIKCLSYLARQSFTDFDVLIVDNGSSDGSEQAVKKLDFPFPLYWIPLGRNFGFARAVNLGIMATKSSYVLLLNNDVWLTSECLGEMVSVMEYSCDISVVSCRVMSATRPDVIDSIGAGITRECKCFQIGWGAKWKSEHINALKTDRVVSVFGATGACALFRRKIFSVVGLFDENFFMYLEDMDWAIRACAKGVKTAIAVNGVAYHVGGATAGGSYSDFSLFWIVRNQLFLIFKNIPGSFILKNLLYILAGQFKTAMKAMIILKRPGIYFRAISNFVKLLPMVVELRKKTEKISSHELDKHIKRSESLKRIFIQ